jgi:hypothetical protein
MKRPWFGVVHYSREKGSSRHWISAIAIAIAIDLVGIEISRADLATSAFATLRIVTHAVDFLTPAM